MTMRIVGTAQRYQKRNASSPRPLPPRVIESYGERLCPRDLVRPCRGARPDEGSTIMAIRNRMGSGGAPLRIAPAIIGAFLLSLAGARFAVAAWPGAPSLRAAAVLLGTAVP